MSLLLSTRRWRRHIVVTTSAHISTWMIVMAAGAFPGCGGQAASPTVSRRPNTPVGHTLSGTVTEAGAGAVNGVVVIANPNGIGLGSSATTDDAGHYRMENVVGCLSVALSRPGYEPSQPRICIELHDDTVFNVTIQRVLRMEAGRALDNTVWTDDPVWTMNPDEDIACHGPCKFVRIALPTNGGTLIVRLSSLRSAARLGLWLSSNSGFGSPRHLVGSGEISGRLAVSAAKEAYVWIEGEEGSDLPFHLNTQLLAPGELVNASP